MIRQFDLSNSNYYSLKVIADNEAAKVGGKAGKGWNFFNIYNLKEFRNVYLAILRSNYNGNISNIAEYCNKHLPNGNSVWTYRRVEEFINAFRNFDIITAENKLKRGIFQDHAYQDELNEEDINVLKDIYYSYFRFKEIHTWFLNLEAIERKDEVLNFRKEHLEACSGSLYSFSYNSRFTDAFFYPTSNNPEVYFLENSNPLNRRVMRFWDVYIAWGRELGLIEKINMEPLLINRNGQAQINCTYHLKNEGFNHTLYDYVKQLYGIKKVFIPELIYGLAMDTKMSIDKIKKFIIDEYVRDRDKFSLDNTSEIFIKVSKFRDKESILYPLYRGSYISHLRLLK